MAVELTLSGALDTVLIDGNFAAYVNDLNIAAASGKQYLIATEFKGGNIALDTRKILIARDRDDESIFVGR